MLSLTKSWAVEAWAPPKMPVTLEIAKPASKPRIARTTRSSIIVKPRMAARAAKGRRVERRRVCIEGKMKRKRWGAIGRCRDVCAYGKLPRHDRARRSLTEEGGSRNTPGQRH